ncbi:MAG: methylornithine synthase PylB, partial [Candidatus Methanomethylophilaceae archaeon]
MDPYLENILESALSREALSREEIRYLLSCEDKDSEDLIFEAARSMTEKVFKNKVFTYGFVYFSTHCQNNCNFCYYRRSNRIDRYRRTAEEAVEISSALRDAGVNLIDLTMGEDPVAYRNGYEGLLHLVSAVNNAVELPIMVSPGAVIDDALPLLKAAGADWYACYQETHNRELFYRLRIGQDYDRRFDLKKQASSVGMLVEEGIMTGIGETIDDIVDSIMTMRDPSFRQVRVMTFIPQNGVPLVFDRQHRSSELRIMAVLRLTNPDKLIPASLDIEGISGLGPRLNAGANVITSIVPPNRSLAGVAQHELDIDNGHRSPDHIYEVLDGMGYRAATNNEYNSLIKKWTGGGN